MALRRRPIKPTFRRRRKFVKRAGKMPGTNILKRVQALEKQAKVTKHLEYTSYIGWREWGAIPGTTETGKGYGGVNYSIHCLNVPNFNPVAFNSVVYKQYEQVYQSSYNLSIEFRLDRFLADNPSTVGISYFIVKPRKELQTLSPSILTSLEWNKHYLNSGLSLTTGTPSEVTEPGFTVCPTTYINRQVFQIIAYKRFYLGNKASIEDIPLEPDLARIETNINNTHKKFFHKIKINKMFKSSFTSASTQGGAMEMTEEKMPLTSKYYLLCFTDQDKDDTSPAHEYLNMHLQGQMKIYISN